MTNSTLLRVILSSGLTASGCRRMPYPVQRLGPHYAPSKAESTSSALRGVGPIRAHRGVVGDPEAPGVHGSIAGDSGAWAVAYLVGGGNGADGEPVAGGRPRCRRPYRPGNGPRPGPSPGGPGLWPVPCRCGPRVGGYGRARRPRRSRRPAGVPRSPGSRARTPGSCRTRCVGNALSMYVVAPSARRHQAGETDGANDCLRQAQPNPEALRPESAHIDSHSAGREHVTRHARERSRTFGPSRADSPASRE